MDAFEFRQKNNFFFFLNSNQMYCSNKKKRIKECVEYYNINSESSCNEMLTNKLTGALICLTLAILYLEHANAWEVVFHVGNEKKGSPTVLDKQTFRIETSANSTTNRRYTLNRKKDQVSSWHMWLE